ncbi:MAG: hypothetical protein E2576_10995 [Alcaligenaceae bacterium]|nr:hypothetical protein [Alcaligenaceae bacterium SAGV5]MPS51266.1 hypothetical protein [Alcaligenaceae bacterium SAGV3]MPT57237.1 hypothetical protein [Alcaligenaceae bacterium]
MSAVIQLQRDAVVAEARAWLRTPYHHRGCVKGVGVDCCRFLEGVWRAAGYDICEITQPYSIDWNLHRDAELIVDGLLQYCDEIDPVQLQPADILAWRYGRTFAHVGIYLGGEMYIHSHRRSGGVVLDRMSDEEVRKRPMRCFAYRWPEGASYGR